MALAPVVSGSAGPASSSRPRVAMVSFEFPEMCLAIANALSRSADVALFVPDRLARLADELDPAVHLDLFPLPRLRQPVRQAGMCGGIVGRLRRWAPDVVHLQSSHLWFNLALALVRGPPLVVTVHDALVHPGDRASARTPQSVIHLGYRRAAQVIVHAEHVKREAVRHVGLDPARIHVIPHVALGPTRQGSWEEGDGRTVLFFGRIWPYKGLEYLIRAQPLISRRVPEARFAVAGTGEDLARYRALMEDPSRFEVIDEFVPVARRAELFARAAVVVLPYVEASQSGVVPLASAFEKPVVVTDVGGLPEAVEAGRTGLIVPPRDARALADAVVAVLEDPQLARGLGAAARAKLERESSAPVVAERMLRVYEAARGRA